MSQSAYFGVDGKQCLKTDGFAVSKFKYDSRKNNVKGRFFGVNGKLKNRNEGFARYVFQYEKFNKVIDKKFYDALGNPVTLNQDWP